MRAKAIFAAMLLALAPLPSVAQDFDVAVAAFKSGDYATAMREFTLLAALGDAKAQFNLGRMYEIGEGVLQDYAEAVRWYRLAAEQGNDYAQNNLGIMYATGRGVRQDYVLAHMWANIAAANGSEKAVEARERLDRMMNSTDIAEAQRRARVCMESNYQDCE